MKRLLTTALLVGGAVLASPPVFGQAVSGNLYLGFQNQAAGATADYIIHLGPVSGIVGQSSVVNLSSDFSASDFNAVLGSSSSMFGGVVGVESSNTNAAVFVTQLRVGGAGDPAVAGSSVAQALSQAQDNKTYSDLSTLDSTNAGTGTLDTGKSWETLVDPINELTGVTPAFQTDTGLNPDSAVTNSSVLYEDLWETTSSAIVGTKPFTYLGFFTLDLTGASPKLTFTSTNVPPTLVQPTIATITKSGTTVTIVSGNAVPSFNYQLLFTASLDPTNWVPVGSAVVANAATVTNTIDTTNSQGFYQVQAQ